MTSIGEKLRRQRLQNKTSLETVSLETKIGVRLLEAIEAGQFEKLPGGVFRRSFVLQYARALGLDLEEIATELNQLSQFDEVSPLPSPTPGVAHPEDLRPAFSFREDFGGFRGSTIGSLIAAVGVIMACALVYSWWQSGATSKVHSASAPPAASAEVAAPAPPPAPASAAPTQPAPTEPEQRRVVPAVAPPASVPEAALTKPFDPAHVRVGLSADERTWVSVSSDGKNVFSSSLEPHETKVVEALGKVRLLVGNAGGVVISLNGKPIGPIGPRGQVRVVELTPTGFQIVPRKPPTLEPL